MAGSKNLREPEVAPPHLCTAAGTEEAAAAHTQAVRSLAHLMHSHLVEFLRDHLRRPELQVRRVWWCARFRGSKVLWLCDVV